MTQQASSACQLVKRNCAAAVWFPPKVVGQARTLASWRERTAEAILIGVWSCTEFDLDAASEWFVVSWQHNEGHANLIDAFAEVDGVVIDALAGC
jgi:hypothetical protein